MVNGNGTGTAPKKFVDIFFREERMAIEEGWRISEVPIDEALEGPLFAEVARVSEFVPEDGQCPWVTLAPGGAEDPINEGGI